MKLTQLIAPIVASVIFVSLIGGQQRTIATLTEKTTLLRERLAKFAQETKAEGKNRVTETEKKLDLKSMAKTMKDMENQQGMGDLRANLRVQIQLMAMSVEELVAALEEVGGLDLSEATSKILRNQLLSLLAKKDPALVLQKFGEELLDNGGWMARTALSQFAEKDPLAAVAWVDEQAAKGHLENKSLNKDRSPLIAVEAALLQSLLGKQDSLMTERLAALTATERQAVLRQIYLDPKNEAAHLPYAKMVRQGAPSDEQVSILADKFASVVLMGNMDEKEATEFFDNLNSSPEERGLIATQMLRNSMYSLNGGLNELEKSYHWVKKWAPEESAASMGQALANASIGNDGGGEEKETVDRVLKLRQEGESEELVIAYLKHNRTSNLSSESVRRLFEQISESEEKSALQEKFKEN